MQNLAPGAAERLGLGGQQLRERDERLVVVNLSGYGSSGPRADRKAYDMLVQAESGLVSITGTPEQATKTGIPTADIAAGMYVLTSVLSALYRRERTGQERSPRSRCSTPRSSGWATRCTCRCTTTGSCPGWV
nr:CoA transferase [Janibacter melonis]